MKEILKSAALALVLAAGFAVADPGPTTMASAVSQDIPSMVIVRVAVDSNDEESAPVLIPVNYDKDVVDETTAQEALDAADQQGLEEISLENQARTVNVPLEVTEIEDAFSKAQYDDTQTTLISSHRMPPWARHGRFHGRGRGRGVWWGVGGGKNWGWYSRPVTLPHWARMTGFRVPARYGFAINHRIVPFFHSPFSLRRAQNRFFFYSRPF